MLANSSTSPYLLKWYQCWWLDDHFFYRHIQISASFCDKQYDHNSILIWLCCFSEAVLCWRTIKFALVNTSYITVFICLQGHQEFFELFVKTKSRLLQNQLSFCSIRNQNTLHSDSNTVDCSCTMLSYNNSIT